MRLPFSLTINTLLLGILALFIVGNIANYYLTYTADPYEIPGSALPAPQQVGKSKVYVSKERDASMYTESTRRRAIQGANRVATKDPKFIYWNKGSTNGSLETFFLTSICPCLPSSLVSKEKVCNYLYDGGDGNANYCYVLDGNGQEYVLDLGNATTTNCST
jgi:hypothetical protein